jgi:hypothetical protein
VQAGSISRDTTVPISPSVTNLYPQLAALAPGPLQALAMAAESFLVQSLGREISAGTKIQTFKGENQTILWLNCSPVTALISVVISGNSADITGLKFDSDGRLSRQYQGFQNQLSGWTPGISNIVVTYTSDGLDQTVQDMLIGAFMCWMLDMQSKSSVASSESIGDYSYVLNTAFMKGLPPFLSTLIQPYRIMAAG